VILHLVVVVVVFEKRVVMHEGHRLKKKRLGRETKEVMVFSLSSSL